MNKHRSQIVFLTRNNNPIPFIIFNTYMRISYPIFLRKYTYIHSTPFQTLNSINSIPFTNFNTPFSRMATPGCPSLSLYAVALSLLALMSATCREVKPHEPLTHSCLPSSGSLGSYKTCRSS